VIVYDFYTILSTAFDWSWGKTRAKHKAAPLNERPLLKKCIEILAAEMQIGSLIMTTATPRTTPCKIVVITFTASFAIFWICRGCLCLWNLAQAKYVTAAFNSKWKYEKLAVWLVVRILRPPQNAVILRCCFAKDGYEIFKSLQNTLVQPLFFSLNFLFGFAHCRGGFLQAPSRSVHTTPAESKTHTALFNS